MVETQNSVEDRLARIENMLEKISQGVGQAPTMLAMATDSIDELINAESEGCIRFENSLSNGLNLLRRLSEPKIHSALSQLLNTLEQGPGLVSMIMDSMDSTIEKANQGSVRLDDRFNGLAKLLAQISDPKMLDKLDGLFDLVDQSSGLTAMVMDSLDEIMTGQSILDDKNFELIKKLGAAVSEARDQTPAEIGGIWSLMRIIKDPERQKALGFLMNILKQFGKKI